MKKVERIGPGRQARKYGVTIKRVAEVIGKTPRTVSNWGRDNPVLFKIVCEGVVQMDDKTDA